MPTGSPTSAVGNQEGADPPLGRGETLPLPLAEYAQVVECRLERGVALELHLPQDLPHALLQGRELPVDLVHVRHAHGDGTCLQN